MAQVNLEALFEEDEISSGQRLRWLAESGEWSPVAWTHAVFDLENARPGWALIARDTTPEFRFHGPRRGPKPNDGQPWRKAVRIVIWINGERYCWDFPISGVCDKRVQQLMREFNAATEQHPGQLPLVEFQGPHPLAGPRQLFEPLLTISRWVDRPATSVGKPPDSLPNDDIPF